MKLTQFFYSVLFTCLLVWVAQYSLGQKRAPVNYSRPQTILWKITGNQCPQPSYLLGTFHLADLEWLYEYPQIKKVIDSTSFILTEAFSTEPVQTTSVQNGNRLKAIPLLTKAQFFTLDSFFVARVGEGIEGNVEAEKMTVAEMGNAIVTTLAAQTKGANGITQFMDLDLFKRYEKLGRSGDRLDRVAPTEFDSTSINEAKAYLARSLKYIENSDKPGWNIYHMTDVDATVERYKKMAFDYKFDEHGVKGQTSADFDFIPMHQRNQNWMSKIVATISTRPTLIAVGLGHLYYRTGLIMLLRSAGFRVEPVVLRKPD